ncbi:LUD domain-containing protein [Candidatus Sulfidibacterium hydrothermale]|uniref:LutC/YkgG family protein n=1 Tax=Candidatus Sulfidibacterium hydrothermale TaxID=2875962 RepID=UPI001F0A97DF|nr:LUD domain-containing protein [Candidatus Sulfidibacterium hydrothermale]UBM61191.1 LUD domain-containing protein [Candidatus Sulfidibacterium hydrothermale]
MEESTTKEKILKRVRDALISKKENPFKNVDFSSPVLVEEEEEREVAFARKLMENGGSFVYCENEKALGENLKMLLQQKKWDAYYVADKKLEMLLQSLEIPFQNDPEAFLKMQAGMTRCEYLIARFGSVLVSSGLDSGRRMFVYPETHIVISTTSQVVPELQDALAGMRKRYQENFPSQMTVITGPSRTADIEKTLVMGAHGPRELFVFVVDDED